jgi:hypothetical protein
VFPKWVLFDLKYCQEKYFQTHFLNNISDMKVILNYPPNYYCKPSSSVGDIFLKTWAFGFKGLLGTEEYGCGKQM